MAGLRKRSPGQGGKRRKSSPSPTRNWYSGPDGVVSTLFVSIMGITLFAPSPAL